MSELIRINFCCQLQDILKFGVDALLNEEEAEQTDVDFNKLLGSSVGGEWQTEAESHDQDDQSAVSYKHLMIV